MPTDQLLVTLIRSLQIHSDQQDTSRLLGTASSLLTTLSNPLNLTVLTAQLLIAPAIWTQPDGLHTCLSFMQTFQSTAMAIIQYEHQVIEHEQKGLPHQRHGQPTLARSLSRQDWVKAVVKGADDRSPRWRHMMVLAGLLIGFKGQKKQGLTQDVHYLLERALVKATNLTLEDLDEKDEITANALSLTLNYVFELLSTSSRGCINYNKLLPVLIASTFFSPSEGYRSGYFFATVDLDIEQVEASKFAWSDRSRSFAQISSIASQPLIVAMGPLARLIGHSVEHVTDSWLLQPLMDDLLRFANTIASQWRRCKFSEVDSTEETLFFEENTVAKTLPVLLKVMRSALFATVIILRSVMGRILNDRHLATPAVAPILASHSLHILRHLYFLSTRLGAASFTQHAFVHLTAIDILGAHPEKASAFLHSVRPIVAPGQIPPAPVDRNLDLFFLNTAEHFAYLLSPKANEELLIHAVTPYLAAGDDNRLIEIFEAAHSVMLSVLSAPSSSTSPRPSSMSTTPGPLISRYLPFYTSTLFSVFPANLSARQFRLAFRTLVEITTAPASSVSALQADFSETLLEILYTRALSCTESVCEEDRQGQNSNEVVASENGRLQEKTTLTLALLDTLPSLSPQGPLEYWLSAAAQLVGSLPDSSEEQKRAKSRFWEVLSQGEMDAQRSLVAVQWWTSGGGRKTVLGLKSGEIWRQELGQGIGQDANEKASSRL